MDGDSLTCMARTDRWCELGWSADPGRQSGRWTCLSAARLRAPQRAQRAHAPRRSARLATGTTCQPSWPSIRTGFHDTTSGAYARPEAVREKLRTREAEELTFECGVHAPANDKRGLPCLCPPGDFPTHLSMQPARSLHEPQPLFFPLGSTRHTQQSLWSSWRAQRSISCLGEMLALKHAPA